MHCKLSTLYTVSDVNHVFICLFIFYLFFDLVMHLFIYFIILFYVAYILKQIGISNATRLR